MIRSEVIESDNIITLCGSTKFKKSFDFLNLHLTLNGNIILQPGCFAHADNITITEEQKENLDKLHLKKIDMASIIIIVNENDYIGSSTRNEIEYSIKQNKKIYYMFKNGSLNNEIFII